MSSLAFHDVTGFDPRALPGQARFSCPGCSASAEISVRHQPKSVYDFGRNRCSASSEMAVRFRPSYTALNSNATKLDYLPSLDSE